MSHWVNVIIEEATTSSSVLPQHITDGLKRISKIVEVSDAVQFRTDELELIAEAISECTGMQELSQLLWQTTIAFGFQNFSLFVISQGSSTAFPSRLCTSLKKKWLTHYFDRSFQYVDPVAHRASTMDGSFLFSDLSSTCPLIDEYWKDAEEYGVGSNGFCQATTRPDGSRLAISFLTSASSNVTADIVRLNLRDLCAVANLAIETFCNLSSGNALHDADLTVQELKFLHMIATSPDPEKAFNRNHCDGSNQSMQSSIQGKLGVDTIFQAVSVASAKCLFDNLPYYYEEVLSTIPQPSGWELEKQHEYIYRQEMDSLD